MFVAIWFVLYWRLNSQWCNVGFMVASHVFCLMRLYYFQATWWRLNSRFASLSPWFTHVSRGVRSPLQMVWFVFADLQWGYYGLHIYRWRQRECWQWWMWLGFLFGRMEEDDDVATFGWLNFKCFSADTCNIPGSPKPCQVTTARCAPTPHPSPSIHTGWVVASGDRTPNLTFNTPGKPANVTSCAAA